jgi:glycosyltransferase involved in cell wall biosynthesis
MRTRQTDILPLVSVVVTVYDRIQFLRNALQGVLEQTFRSFEIIVTDDSNKSEIKSICNSFRQGDIHYRANSSPLGVALNLRTAISQAKRKYIAILNDDDVWEPEFLELLVTPLIDSPERVLAFSDHWIILEDGQIDVDRTDENTALYRRNTLQEGEIHDWERLAVLDHAIPLAVAGVFPKNAINWDLLVGDVAGAYDFWLSCLLASTRRPVYYIPRCLSKYRVHGLMETARKTADKGEAMVFIYGRLIEMNLFPPLKEPLQRRYRDALFGCGKDYLLFDRLSEARQYFLRSLKTSPNAKALAGLLLTCLPKRFRMSCISSQRMLHRRFAFWNRWGRARTSRQ